ncbi:MAG TPA: formyltransferase family protein [Vicinamibacterales bacterium]|nr:formyltransferase family protein [Vicinamibacterales bacterium]
MTTVVYTFESPATLAVAKRLVDSGKVSAVILQRPMTTRAKLKFLRRRLSRHGLVRVVDELLFQLYYRLFLQSADERLRRLLELSGSASRTALAQKAEVFDVDSMNSPESQALLRRLAPDLVVMASRELIRPDVLKLARLGFIGCHPGILPDFRGAYASFWAMHEGRQDKVGISVYLANAGIDTGPLVAERVIPPRFGVQHFKVESERLILEGVTELLDAIDQTERGTLKTFTKPDAPGPLYSLVGLSDYLHAARR